MKSIIIPAKVIEEWKNSPQAKFDNLCVERGKLLRQGVSKAEVDRRLPLPKQPVNN